MNDTKTSWTTPELLVMSSGSEADGTIPKIVTVGECFQWDGNNVCVDYILDEQGES